MPHFSDFHIHGDNIVECERAFELIKRALAEYTLSVRAAGGSPVCPQFEIARLQGQPPFRFTFYPGFSRWDDDIIQFVRERGGTLREAADVIITGVSLKHEEPLLAIEYCGALPAGNQAWQRNGRAYSYALAGIPYLYVAELGGYELDADRNRKSARMPNPAVPFSYLSYSLEQQTCVLPVFLTSPGADSASRRAHADDFADDELIALTRGVLLDQNPDRTYELLRQKVLALVKKLATQWGKKTLTPEQWDKAYSSLKQGRSLVEFLVDDGRKSWSKKAYIAGLTATAKALMGLTSTFAIGLTSTELPMCIVPANKRLEFSSRVCSMYRDLPHSFIDWLRRPQHLAICWIMGFKPRGDDARPDRGLPPLARMLIGDKCDLLSVVYGPAPAGTWIMLRDTPAALIKRNGLWEAILAVSDGLLVDTATDTVTNHGFVRTQWESVIPKAISRNLLVTPSPVRIGENDVDTVLHTLLARHAGPQVFEGGCNPPGGDWSGISLQSVDRECELRWLSLPRVSGSDTKRPDHVFQIFGIAPKPIIFSVESKEVGGDVEKEIGPRLNSFISNLIASPASIERKDCSSSWQHSDHLLDPDLFIFATGAAFISDSKSQIASVIAKAKTDLVLVYNFSQGGGLCDMLLIPNGRTGRLICEYVAQLDLNGTGISIRLG